MRLKLRFSKFCLSCIKEYKNYLISKGYPSTITNGFVLDTALESIADIDITFIDWINVATAEEDLLADITKDDTTTNSSLTIRQSSYDFIIKLRNHLSENVFDSRVYSQYAVKIIMISALLKSRGLFPLDYYIKH